MANAPGQGRPAKPTALLKAQGTYEKGRHADRIDDQVPMLVNAPDPPSVLGEEGARLWVAVTEGYLGFGILTAIDLPLLESACVFYQNHIDYEKQLDGNRFLVDDNGNPFANPLYKASLDYWKAAEKIFKDFGLTPSTRAKLRVSAPKEETGNKWGGI